MFLTANYFSFSKKSGTKLKIECIIHNDKHKVYNIQYIMSYCKCVLQWSLGYKTTPWDSKKCSYDASGLLIKISALTLLCLMFNRLLHMMKKAYPLLSALTPSGNFIISRQFGTFSPMSMEDVDMCIEI